MGIQPVFTMFGVVARKQKKCVRPIENLMIIELLRFELFSSVIRHQLEKGPIGRLRAIYDRIRAITIKGFYIMLSILMATSFFVTTNAIARPRILTGEISQQRVVDLTSQIPWYRSIYQAESAARQQGKLIFWVHMLGSLDGAT